MRDDDALYSMGYGQASGYIIHLEPRHICYSCYPRVVPPSSLFVVSFTHWHLDCQSLRLSG